MQSRNDSLLFSLRYKKALHIARLSYYRLSCTARILRKCPMKQATLDTFILWLVILTIRVYAHFTNSRCITGLNFSRVKSSKPPSNVAAMLHSLKLPVYSRRSIDRQRANSCFACVLLRLAQANDIYMSRMDSINKIILLLFVLLCQYTVEIFTRLALCRLV